MKNKNILILFFFLFEFYFYIWNIAKMKRRKKIAAQKSSYWCFAFAKFSFWLCLGGRVHCHKIRIQKQNIDSKTNFLK